jgi:hypothetical protein
MNRMIAILALSTAFGATACSEPNREGPEGSEATMEAPIALPAEDAASAVVDPSAVDTPPADSTTLPAEKRSSEESVQPESETLFY